MEGFAGPFLTAKYVAEHYDPAKHPDLAAAASLVADGYAVADTARKAYEGADQKEKLATAGALALIYNYPVFTKAYEEEGLKGALYATAGVLCDVAAAVGGKEECSEEAYPKALKAALHIWAAGDEEEDDTFEEILDLTQAAVTYALADTTAEEALRLMGAVLHHEEADIVESMDRNPEEGF